MEENIEEKLKSVSIPVVIDFWAPWCGPCKSMSRPLEEVIGQFAGRVEVWKVNTDEQPDVARKLNVTGIPTLVGFYLGKEVGRQVGGINRNTIHDFFSAVEQGKRLTGITSRDRSIRLLAAGALIYLAFAREFNWILLVMGLVVLIFATYDKIPLLKALPDKLKIKNNKG